MIPTRNNVCFENVTPAAQAGAMRAYTV